MGMISRLLQWGQRVLAAVVLLAAFAPQAQAISATGGTVTNYTVGGTNYQAHIFAGSGTLTVTSGGQMEYLVVAGGGAGGNEVSTWSAGGGGGGGVLTGIAAFTNGCYAITVGAGGVNANGGNSILNGLTAIGGGKGGTLNGSGAGGGSGGGSGSSSGAGGSGTSGQGYAGGNSSGGTWQSPGGGGAGGVGSNAGPNGSGTGGNGGAGVTSAITGVMQGYAGGGGGGWYYGNGGTVSQGGGRGGAFRTVGTAGAVNTGGGGGGAGDQGGAGGAGGSGMVIVRYEVVPSTCVPAPIITPAGGAFSQPQAVTITPAVLAPLTTTPGWRTGVKFPGAGLESAEALSSDGQTVAAMRARTMARTSAKFPGVNLSPDSGAFPFYIWSLSDLSGTYLPALQACLMDVVDWDGNNYGYSSGGQGNRLILVLHQTQHYLRLYSCGSGANLGTTSAQTLTDYNWIPINDYASHATMIEVSSNTVRIVFGGQPLTSSATDANGWITYTGDAASGRVTAPLGATRFWIGLSGGDQVGSREMIISDKPKTTTRFTFDGSPVTEASPVVTGPLTLTHDATIRARVYSAAAYRSPETVAVFTSNIPLLPAESVVSPAYISIAHATLDGTPAQVSLDGPSGVMPGLAIGDFRYLMRYPLLPYAPTPLTLHRSGLADLTGSVLWRALEIGVAPDTQIRLGESVILSASNTIAGELVITVTDASGAVYTEHRTLNTEHSSFPVLFDRAGTFTAVATLDGISFASLVISVTQVDLQGPIACQIGYRREKEVLVYGPASAVFFTANDPTLLEVSVKETTARGVRLYLKPLKAGTPILQARLGSPTGPILAQQEVDEFALRSQATTYIGVVETFSDGAKLLQTNLEMDPQVVNLNVSMHIIIRGVTFEDSTLDKTINTSAFTYNAASGKWLCAYRMISTPDLFTGSCHSLAIYQGSDPVGQ